MQVTVTSCHKHSVIGDGRSAADLVSNFMLPDHFPTFRIETVKRRVLGTDQNFPLINTRCCIDLQVGFKNPQGLSRVSIEAIKSPVIITDEHLFVVKCRGRNETALGRVLPELFARF